MPSSFIPARRSNLVRTEVVRSIRQRLRSMRPCCRHTGQTQWSVRDEGCPSGAGAGNGETPTPVMSAPRVVLFLRILTWTRPLEWSDIIPNWPSCIVSTNRTIRRRKTSCHCARLRRPCGILQNPKGAAVERIEGGRPDLGLSPTPLTFEFHHWELLLRKAKIYSLIFVQSKESQVSRFIVFAKEPPYMDLASEVRMI
jgi:hypothetical protein